MFSYSSETSCRQSQSEIPSRFRRWQNIKPEPSPSCWRNKMYPLKEIYEELEAIENEAGIALNKLRKRKVREAINLIAKYELGQVQDDLPKFYIPQEMRDE